MEEVIIHTFSCTTDKRTTKITSYGVTLDEVLTDFELYLKGCGFVYDGELSIVEDSYSENESDKGV